MPAKAPFCPTLRLAYANKSHRFFPTPQHNPATRKRVAFGQRKVLVVDRRQKTITKRINVVPRCAEPGEKEVACKCLCRKGYVLGQMCGEDAGAP